MPYKVLADFTVLVHFLWILFLVLGALWGRRSRTVRWIHLGGLGFAGALQVFDWYCPLTHLESWLRVRHDPHTAYTGSYLIHYIEKVVYLEVPHSLIVVLTLALCAVNLRIYLKR